MYGAAPLLHLAGGDQLTSFVLVGANTSTEPPAHRQMILVLIVADWEISTHQGSQVKLIASPRVSNTAVITWKDGFGG